MKLSIAIFALLVGLCLQATAQNFDTGAPEYDSKVALNYTEAEIQKKIQEEMAIACRDNLCRIVGTDNSGSSWTVSFNVGYGQNPNNGTGNNIYIGDDNQNQSDKGYAGLTVTYKNYTCRANMNVTPAVYRFVNTYLYNMVNTDGSVKRNFSPADQTVILFYTTMLQKVESCKSGNL